MIPVQGYIQLRPQDTTLPSFGSGPPATAATTDENLSTEVAVRDGGGKASPSVSISLEGTSLFSYLSSLQMQALRYCDRATITFATIVSRGYYSLREFRSGRCRSCLFAIYGAASVPLNGVAHGALIWCCFFDSLVAKDCQYPRDPTVHEVLVHLGAHAA